MISPKKAKEDRVVADVLKEAKDRGAYVIRNNAGGLNPKGIPDFTIVYRGWALGVELKRPSAKGVHGRPTYVQKENLQRLTESGGIGVICASLTFFKKVLDACEVGTREAFCSLGYGSDRSEVLYDDRWMEEVVW